MLFMAVFVVMPLVLIMVYAFQGNDGGFSLENFRRFVNQAEAANTFIYSIGIALITTIICLILGYPAAYILTRLKPSTASLVVMLFILPMWINVLVRTLATVALFDFLRLPLGEGALIFGMVYNFLPYMILPIYTSRTKIDNSLLEAARDLGSNGFHVFKRVILPLSVPGIISGITMVFIPSISTFIISRILGGGKDFLIGDLIEDYFLGNSGVVNYNIGAALSMVLMVLILVATFFMNHFDKDAKTSGGGRI